MGCRLGRGPDTGPALGDLRDRMMMAYFRSSCLKRSRRLRMAAVPAEKIFCRQAAEIIQCSAQLAMVPIPPGKIVHPLADLFREALADELRGNAANDGVGCYVFGSART